MPPVEAVSPHRVGPLLSCVQHLPLFGRSVVLGRWETLRPSGVVASTIITAVNPLRICQVIGRAKAGCSTRTP